MDQKRFDAMTRSLTSLPSRREILRRLGGTGLGLAALWSPNTTEAKKKKGKKKKTKTPAFPSPASPPPVNCIPRCGHTQCGNDGCGGSCGSCPAGRFCRSGTCCTPEPSAVTCAGRCGTVTSIRTCGQPVACSCPSDQVCLSNGSCAIVCNAFGDCPASPACSGCSDPDSNGARHCLRDACGTPCTSTADCPPGTKCQPQVGCPGSSGNQCAPLCNNAPV